MAEQGYKPGQVYEIKPLLIVPDRARTFGPGGGGGYSGNGDGWGLQEGPPRGTGGTSTRREIALPNVMSEFMNEQIHSQQNIDSEYTARFQTLISDVEQELSDKVQAVVGMQTVTGGTTALEQKAALDLTKSKRAQYEAIAPNIYGLYGQSPYFMMHVLPRQKIRELLNSGDTDQAKFIALYSMFDSVYRSALELKLLSLSIDILGGKLSGMASRRAQVEPVDSMDQVSWQAVLNERLDIVSVERDIHVQRLPEFLQTELTAIAGSISGLTPVQAMKHYTVTLERMAASKTATIKPVHAPPPFSSGGVTVTFPPNNPKVNAPLSKPELEALNELVYLQTNTAVGTKWLSYHDALLKSESARHLQAIAHSFSELATRLEDIQQTIEAKRASEERLARQAEANRIADAQAAAERTAAEEAQAAEAAKAATTFHISGPEAATQPILVTAAGTVTVLEGAAFVLQAAIRSAVAALVGTAAGAASGVVVGIAALAYPSDLADGELPERYALGIPLADLATVDDDKLSDVAHTGNTVHIDVRISSRTTHDEESELIAIRTDGVVIPSEVKVFKALYNADKNEYSLTPPDTPNRTIIWTPIADTGNSSTTFPNEPPAPSTYTGAKLKSGTGRIDSFPSIEDIWFDDFITVFPADSGLPPIYVMFRDRREEPGTATGTGTPVTGAWLGAMTPDAGAPIPSQIADKLRERDYANFRAFREAFWKAVAADPELSRQFSSSSVRRINQGLAPYASSSEHIGGQRKYELHHVIFLKDGGMVYDIDNIRIVTPRQHNSAHYKKSGE